MPTVCKHAHGCHYACTHVWLYRKESIRYLLWLPVIAQSLFHSSSNTLLGNLPLSNENNIRASFICVLLKLFIYRAVSFCKSLCNLTDRFAGVVTWLGVQELQCDVIVRSGFQKQQHEGTLTFAVWLCLWLWNRGGWLAQCWGCTQVCEVIGCCAKFFFLFIVITSFRHICTCI